MTWTTYTAVELVAKMQALVQGLGCEIAIAYPVSWRGCCVGAEPLELWVLWRDTGLTPEQLLEVWATIGLIDGKYQGKHVTVRFIS